MSTREIVVTQPAQGRRADPYASLFDEGLGDSYEPPARRRVRVYGVPEKITDKELVVLLEVALENDFGSTLPLPWPRLERFLTRKRLAEFDFNEEAES